DRPVRIELAPLRRMVGAPIEAGSQVLAGGRLVLCGEVLQPCEWAQASGERPISPAPERAPEPERRVLEPHWEPGQESGAAPGAEAEPEVRFVAPGADGAQTGVDASRVVQAWRSGTYALEADDGGLVWLPRDWLARYGPILEHYVAARQADGKRPRWARSAAAALCEALAATPSPALAGLAGLDKGEVPAAELPADLQAELRAYQRRGVDWLCLLRDAGIGALLADDMGLGKTLQTICAVRGRTLVVAPTSTLHN